MRYIIPLLLILLAAPAAAQDCQKIYDKFDSTTAHMCSDTLDALYEHSARAVMQTFRKETNYWYGQIILTTGVPSYDLLATEHMDVRVGEWEGEIPVRMDPEHTRWTKVIFRLTPDLRKRLTSGDSIRVRVHKNAYTANEIANQIRSLQ